MSSQSEEMSLRTAFAGLQPAKTISSVFRMWVGSTILHQEDRNASCCVVSLFCLDKAVQPLISSANGNTYLKRLIDIKKFLDMDLICHHNCFGEEKSLEYNVCNFNYDPDYDRDEREKFFEFTQKVRTRGVQAMREYCDEIKKIEAESSTVDAKEKDEILQSSTKLRIENLKEDETFMRWFLDYTLYSYVMQNLGERCMIDENEIDKAKNLNELVGKQTREFVEVVLRRGIQAIRKFDGNGENRKEAADSSSSADK